MNKLLNSIQNLLPTALLVLGAIAVSMGVGMIFCPAGVITAGMLAVAGGTLMMMGQEDKRNE